MDKCIINKENEVAKETLKEEIKRRFGSVRRFGKILGAPMGTPYSWTRKKHKSHPPKYVIKASIDAVTLRSKSIPFWKCKSCGMLIEFKDSGISPNQCSNCGSKYMNAVIVIEKEEVD